MVGSATYDGSEGAGFRERGERQRGDLIAFFERRLTAADGKAACASSDDIGGGGG